MHIFIITGITQGLGSELYRQLKSLNKDVIALSKNHKEDVTSKIIQCDFSKVNELIEVKQSLNKYLNDSISKVTFINNAGVVSPIEQIGAFGEQQKVVEHVNINYIVPMLLIDFIVNAVPSECSLQFLNISTGAAERPLASWSLYSSSKKAIKTFLDTLAIERQNVSVQHIDPGVMDTNMQRVIREQDFPLKEMFVQFEKESKLKSPQQVAQHIISKYVNTQ